MPDPSCPESPCQAIGSVTGFQVSTSQGQLPFRVRKDGKIKFWTLTLSQPTSSQRSFFNGFFGTPPEARLAILRRVAHTNPPRYALRAQGSVHVLSPYLGQTVKFGASLRVKGRHHRCHRPHLGPRLRPGPAFQQRLASQPRSRQVRQLQRRPPGRTAGQGWDSRRIRLPLRDRPTALHSDCRRELGAGEAAALPTAGAEGGLGGVPFWEGGRGERFSKHSSEAQPSVLGTPPAPLPLMQQREEPEDRSGLWVAQPHRQSGSGTR